MSAPNHNITPQPNLNHGDTVSSSRQLPAVEVRRMWSGGPLRQWSETNPSRSWLAYATGGYVAAYVCDQCQVPCDGVYFVRGEQKWLCGRCRKAVRKIERKGTR